MATKAAAKKRLAARKAKKSGAIKSGVYITASLEREFTEDAYGDIVHDYPGSGEFNYSLVSKVFVDTKGNVAGTGTCGETFFVCTKAEIPAFIDFLTKIAAA